MRFGKCNKQLRQLHQFQVTWHPLQDCRHSPPVSLTMHTQVSLAPHQAADSALREDVACRQLPERAYAPHREQVLVGRRPTPIQRTRAGPSLPLARRVEYDRKTSDNHEGAPTPPFSPKWTASAERDSAWSSSSRGRRQSVSCSSAGGRRKRSCRRALARCSQCKGKPRSRKSRRTPERLLSF